MANYVYLQNSGYVLVSLDWQGKAVLRARDGREEIWQCDDSDYSGIVIGDLRYNYVGEVAVVKQVPVVISNPDWPCFSAFQRCGSASLNRLKNERTVIADYDSDVAKSLRFAAIYLAEYRISRTYNADSNEAVFRMSG